MINSLVPVEYEEKRVITTKIMAEQFGTSENSITQNFKRNINRFTEGKHYYKLEYRELAEFKRVMTDSHDPSIKFASVLFLWTERGVARHAKILDTDEAWEVYEVLEETYFKKIKLSQIDILVQAAQQLKILEDEQIRQKEEQQIQNIKIKQLEGKVDIINDKEFTIMGYANMNDILVTNKSANRLGRQASKLSRELGYDIGTASHPVYGRVNTYHLDILDKVFDEMF